MPFIHLIYFYIVILSFLINPKEVILLFHEGARESDCIPLLPIATASQPTSPAISAVLLECPNVQRRSVTSRPDCERQMMVHIRVSPSFQVETLDKFLLLDEVYDQRRKTRAKLMSPYLIEISRGEPVVMYPLQFSKSIRCDTCGHKSGNNTNTSQGNCEHPVDAAIRVPLTVPAIQSGAGVAPISGIHVSRSVQQENEPREQRQQQQQQQHNTNKASVGNGHNPDGPKPSEKIESRQKLAIGILDSPHFFGEANKQANPHDEKGFSARDVLLRAHHQDDGNNMDYDVDEYDELNLNDDGFRLEEDVGFSGQNTLRDKRLKKQPPLQQQQQQSSLSSSNVADDALLRNEKLFREAKRQGEEARIETLRAFTRKHVHVQPFGSDVGSAPVDGYRPTARSWVNVGKPHVVGIQEDCIRPQGAFDVDEIDDVETDVGSKVESSDERQQEQEQKQVPPRLQQKTFLQHKNGHRLGAAEMQGLQLDGATQNSHSGVPVDKYLQTNPNTHKGSISSQTGLSISNLNREEASAILLASSKSLPGSHGSRQKEQQLHPQKLDDIKDVSQKRKFPFTESKEDSSVDDTQRFDAIGNDDVGDDDASNDEDYDKIDASVRDSSVIESKSNITTTTMKSPDDIETVAGGMGDEFYWNTLHYPSSSNSNVNSKHKELSASFDDGFKIAASDRGKFHESLDQNVPRKLSNNVKPNGGVRKNGNKEFGKAVRIQKRRNYNDRQTASARRTPSSKTNSNDKEAATKHPIKEYGRNTEREKFTDKSAMARNRMKIRSSNAGGSGGDSGGVGTGIGGGSGGVVETSGMYTAKDGVVPAFPLNGYPGYLDVKTFSDFSPPEHSQSQYRLLENVPQEYLPHQPPYAKELSDPNLTVNDKISLLEVLSDHDDVKDAILRNLENELDSSVIIHDLTNHDRMPLPSTRLSRSQLKKGIQKRSYLTYDDLTMRDTDEEYDDMDEKQPFDVPIMLNEERNSKSEKCQSCSGNKCPAKRDGESCTCDRQGRHCECTLQKSEKKIRSVSDAWYSVFNMSAPLQFLTTRVGIYRKRHGAWWKTAPSITLTSLSGIYASENLSILFSSHVDIFQLKRPLTLQNHKLLIPHIDSNDAATAGREVDDKVKAKHRNLYESINPQDILAIDSSKFDFNKIHDDSDTNNKEDDQSNDVAAAAVAAKRTLCHATSASELERQRKRRNSHSSGESSSSDAVLSVGDLGYFPGNMNILEQCPSDPNHLCLNMLDKEAPAFTIKIKQPFLENGLLFNDEYNVRIASVISDATTKGALQVAVVLINEDCVAHEFTICICNCPMTCGAKTTVKKDLAPHIGETVSFLLPLEGNKDTKLYCNVEPTARCLCIWDCKCHCIQDLVSYDDYDVCHKLSDYEEQAAGFIEGGVPGQDLTGWRWFWWRMNYYAFSLLLCMLFLGLLKAILGALGLRRFDRCGYDYVQPLRKYDYTSRCRRFFINIVFFVMLPFICCCKCFTPSEEELLMASTEWQCSLIQRGLYEDSSGDADGDNNSGADGIWKKPLGMYYDDDDGQNANDNNDDDDEETILRLSQSFESGRGRVSGLEGSQSRVSMSEFLLSTCEYDDDEEERDRNFVLQALTQSRESIKMLLKSHRSSADLDDMANPSLTAKAEDLIQRLVAAKIVYRTFEIPLQRVDILPGQKYSIQGYFVPSLDSGYQFIATNPLLQRRRITTTTTTPSTGYTSYNLEPPNILRAEHFQRAYRNKLEVLKAGDLSVAPPVDAPCINSSNTTNESQLRVELASSSSPQPLQAQAPLQQSPVSTLSPVDKLEPIANDLVSEHGPAIANDTITRSDRVDDANNGSNLTAKQKDSPRKA